MNCPYCGYVENSAGPTHVCNHVRPHIQRDRVVCSVCGQEFPPGGGHYCGTSRDPALDYMTAKCDRLKEENAELRAEVERLHQLWVEAGDTRIRLEEDVRTLRAYSERLTTENAQLRADKERYRKMRTALDEDLKTVFVDPVCSASESLASRTHDIIDYVAAWIDANTSASEEPPR